MIEVWFLLGAAVIAAIPSAVWLMLFLEFFQLPSLGWIGGALIFWLVVLYMRDSRRQIKKQQEYHDRD